MSELKETLFKCYKELDFDFEKFKDDQNYRIIFQKYGLFFDEIFGLGTGTYSLYIHGPYNPALASIGYEIANNTNYYESISSSVSLTDKAIKIIHTLKEMFNFDTDLLETYSTYLYLLKKQNLPENEDITLNRLQEIKGYIINNHENYIETIVNVHQNLQHKLSEAEVNI